MSNPPMRFVARSLVIVAALVGMAAKADPSPVPPVWIHSLKITILDTPVVGPHGVGEWGFSALVEADGHRILYDTGGRTDVVLRNAKELKVDLSSIPDVVLSHNHPDHVSGLVALRQAVVAVGGSSFELGRGIGPWPVAQ
ncbi:MAG: MBL fold metallo-hydrolase [Opitutaceae bacterium]|nr:MBL fold metallo-hydrolase [Opitutaceae bacterium]